MGKKSMAVLTIVFIFTHTLLGKSTEEKIFAVKAFTQNVEERNQIASAGIAIDKVFSDSVGFVGTQADIQKLKSMGFKLKVSDLSQRKLDFPSSDKAFHNYTELVAALDSIAQQYPKITQRFSIGKSLEGRDLAGIRISGSSKRDTLPTAIFMGGHHAREHLSVEIPLKLAEYLASKYDTDARVRDLIDSREVLIVPMINPDGAEYDIQDSNYKYWRKNRRKNSDGSYGVDLNRNYNAGFGGPGASSSPSSDTFHGPAAFSEPETQAVRDWVRARRKTTVLLSFHTFSELVLWPYGHTNDQVPSKIDQQIFETMGKKMATWNHYTPQKSSDLYLASGDTTDWAYEELKIFAFTFELTPDSMFAGGFYPGASVIEPTFKANIEPALYLIEKAENPYSAMRDQQDPLQLIP
jgi:carboxypeptidase T